MNQIINASSQEMSAIADGTVHLCITSPPYNVGKEYEQELSMPEYLEFLGQVFAEVHRTLCDGGRICVNLANIGRKPYLPLTDHVSMLLTKIGFLQRGEIIWNKSASVGPSTAWGSWKSASNPTLRDVHEYILVFSKTDFKRPKTETSVNTISAEDFTEWTKSIWTMKTESAKKIGHPAPFPIELPHRLINLYSYQDDLVLDPFMGSGTTAVAAIRNNRRYVGYELKEEYVRLAEDRIATELAAKMIDTSIGQIH